MQYELGTFPVRDVVFGSSTRWHDGVLELDRDELVSLVLEGGLIPGATVELARPGESARIINTHDVVDPRVKVNGGGTVYPGICGRPTDAVGEGRTHRFDRVGVFHCLDTTRLRERSAAESLSLFEVGPPAVSRGFVDMSGPGAVTPYARLFNVCVVADAPRDLTLPELVNVTSTATHRVADRIAETVKHLDPPELEVFDFDSRPELPGMVYIPHLSSAEPQPEVGARGTYGTAVYGQIRLSAPWLLGPAEMLDGAVVGAGRSWGGFSWKMANNPIVLDLCRRHGRDVNFLGCIVQRTNWTSQLEYNMAAHRAARLAQAVGAQAAIITTDVRGQRWVGTMLTIQACERAGIKCVLLTEEEDNENAAAPPLLFSPPELKSAVSTGTGDVPDPFPAVSTVIGTIEDAPGGWYEELPPVHGSYGTAHVADYYGFGPQSYTDF